MQSSGALEYDNKHQNFFPYQIFVNILLLLFQVGVAG